MSGLSSEEKVSNDSELEALEGSKVVKCSTHTKIKVRGKIIDWPWKLKCGLCNKNTILRFDADLKGRVSNFNTQHFLKCIFSSTEKQDEPLKQTTLEGFLNGKKRKAKTGRR